MRLRQFRNAVVALMVQPLIATLFTQQAMAADAVGTGGIALDRGSEHWPAPQAGMPHVVVKDGDQPFDRRFTIQTANGRFLEVPSDHPARDRFLTLWLQLHDPRNGYFSSNGLPFHAVETLIVEAPDYGHLTTSEGISYWAWLEAAFGRYTGDYSLLHYVYDRMETYVVPKFQFGVDAYNPSSPATYAPEQDSPSDYPVPFVQSVKVGQDPIARELSSTYGSSIYGMHWLIDTTNWYGYGQGSDPVFINTFQRGPMESVFLTVPHPEIDEFRYGAPNQGFLSLFGIDPSGYKRQWRYTNAPDADARMVQATYIAMEDAKATGNFGAVRDLAEKASRMGDYLRYALFDKYFKAIGCHSQDCQAGSGYDSAHYLLAWYYSWGGSYPEDQGRWSWRIGGSHSHFGYQNPLAAYVLSSASDFQPRSPGGVRDWQQSLQRQLEFYEWLQAVEGGIAGGATNSWQGRYLEPPAGQSSFYGLSFDPNPVYHNPNSNNWFGCQAWSMQRVAEYYRFSGDHQVEPLLDRWVNWVVNSVKFTDYGGYQIPSTLSWSGQPQTWDPAAHGSYQLRNTNLHVSIIDYTEDVGIATSLAKALLNYVKGSGTYRQIDTKAAADLARELVDRTWNHYRDEKGVSNNEPRPDYINFNANVYVPASFKGKLANGAETTSTSTFLSLRPRYRDDPDFSKVQNYLNGGPIPVFHYHRFWAQVEAALSFSDFDRLTP